MTFKPFLQLCACSALLVGCTNGFTEYEVGSDGRYHKVGTFTEEEHWKRVVQKDIAREKAGTLPKANSQTVKQYWQAWYQMIRRSGPPAWKNSEIKTAEGMVAYIKQQRSAAGLPTYD